MRFANEHPDVGPELISTPYGFDRPVISLEDFAVALRSDRRPVKAVLMDQSVIAGIGNIYANEGCHLAGVDPRWPACSVPSVHIPLLLAALQCVVSHFNPPKVTYQ